ncbi:MAG: hypothetical protein WCO48_02325 [Candidatus Taylorbacteria bacterium]
MDPNPPVAPGVRKQLPDNKQAVTHRFDISGHTGFITVGLFDDGQPCEVFVLMAKEGSTIGGLLDTLGTLLSLNLQYGVPLELLVSKLAHQQYEPSGFTKNPDISIAKSITDYIIRWMACQFIRGWREQNTPQPHPELPLIGSGKPEGIAKTAQSVIQVAMANCPPCDVCEAITVRNGACYKCLNCGNSMGCS